jgi:hypothetical protein
MTDSIDLKMIEDNIIDIPDDRDYLAEDYFDEENAD